MLLSQHEGEYAKQIAEAVDHLRRERQQNSVAGNKCGSKYAFIVEGPTDVDFYKQRLTDIYYCIAVYAFYSIKPQKDADCGQIPGAAPRTIPTGLENNCKELVIYTIVNENKISPGARGAIDKDFDSPEEYTKIEGLYVTDTHDMETLLISTNPKGLIDEIVINGHQFRTALFVSYQISIYKKMHSALIKYRKNCNPANDEMQKLFDLISRYGNKKRRRMEGLFRRIKQYTKEGRFTSSVEEVKKWMTNDGTSKIIFKKFCENANKDYDDIPRMSPDEFNAAVTASLDAMTMFGIDKRSGLLTASLNDYRKTLNDSDLYNRVNGHDLVAILSYYSRQDRKTLENSIRKKYPQNPERQCDMFEDMKKDGVLYNPPEKQAGS